MFLGLINRIPDAVVPEKQDLGPGDMLEKKFYRKEFDI